jgi:SAM-dependent methyltransferase
MSFSRPLPDAAEAAATADLLACPDCATPLDGTAGCGGCGRQFGQQDGRPVLMPTRARRLAFTLPPEGTNPGAIPSGVLRYPPRHGQPRGGTYHLDRAHEDVLTALPKGALVVETGCGGGQMRAWVTARGLRYLGTDVATTRVHDWLQAHGGPDVLCDAHALPLRDGVADAVYAAAVWEHLAFPAAAAQEAARVLRPGGWCLGSMSFLEPWHDESYAHMTPWGVWSTLRLGGLDPVAIWPEERWSGFRALLEMGNKATRPLRPLAALMNAWYRAPKAAQHWWRSRRRPTPQDLIRPIATMAGAVAWIARKPGEAAA